MIFVGFWKLFCSNFALSLDVILNTFQDFAWVLWGRLEVLWGSFGGPLGFVVALWGFVWVSFGVAFAVLGGLVGVLGGSWMVHGGSSCFLVASGSVSRFPGFSTKFQDAFWRQFWITSW